MTRKVYRVAEQVWDSLDNDWLVARYEQKYYRTRFFAVRRALKLQMQLPNHKYVIETRSQGDDPNA